MAAEVKKEIALEVAHVLFIDIVGYSTLMINEQSEQIEQLRKQYLHKRLLEKYALPRLSLFYM